MSLLIKVLPVKETDTFIDYKLYSISLFVIYSLFNRDLHVYLQNKVTKLQNYNGFKTFNQNAYSFFFKNSYPKRNDLSQRRLRFIFNEFGYLN